MAKKPWSKIVEAHGIRIRLYEGHKGTIYRDFVVGRVVSASGKARTEHDKKSLGHKDRKLAEQQAKALAEHVAKNRLTGVNAGSLSLGRLFAAYRTHRVPALSPARRKEAEARISMFSDAWGTKFNATDVDQTRVNLYCEKRRKLEVVAPGKKLDGEGKRKRGWSAPRPVRDGALDGECRWLNSVFNWARGFKINGRRLMVENPLTSVEWPKEKNPRRPVASHARYLATMEHTDVVDPMGRLRCILALARYTGRRESALCAIRASDLLLTPERIREALAAAGQDEGNAEHMPHGAIRWAEENDKEGFLFISPINRAAREELDRYMTANPKAASEWDVPLFPAPRDATAHMRRETAATWLLRAEKLAGLPKLAGGVFHPYRRLWASERMHLPDVAVAKAGGWKDTQALKLSYQHADAETVLLVVEA